MSVLGGLSPAAFLRRHWQKRPLLIRQAFPGFAGIVSRDALLRLATRPDASSRLVIQHPRRRRNRWERHDGPFAGLDASMLPASHWTLLVHGIESLVPGGWEILRAFSFLPAARIDDLMVSYAADGGTVGPHDDRYDVFLLQGPGKRRWQVSRQRDRAVDPHAAINVLRSFVPEDEWLLEPGDMLYLPPSVAHHGVAEGPCFTYSIGFLAPSHAELVQNFLEYLGATLGERMSPAAQYQDPDLRPTLTPQEIGAAMMSTVAGVLGRVRIPKATFSDFLGRFLTRPKAQVRFAVPPPIDERAFARRLSRRGTLSLALPSRGLGYKGRLFLNGQAFTPGPTASRLLLRLFQDRALPLPIAVPAATVDWLHACHAAGYLTIS
ncbi:MAG TPA: cupin domain-containing protein [Polyangia bacterium]|jgi:50S ribosomal protein L16 3-hydroxylase|nr:cupin domain-containing protein [Polyangia bacterium]